MRHLSLACLVPVALANSLHGQIPMFEPGAAMALGAPPGTDDRSPTLNGDETVLIFASNRIGSFFDIFLSTRPSVGAPFSPPVPEAALNSGFDDRDPQLVQVAPGVFELWFVSSRPGGAGPSSIWVSRGAPGAWSPPTLAPGTPGPNLPGWSNRSPALTDDGLTMYFTSDGGGAAAGGADIYVVRRPSLAAPWGLPAPFGPANSPAVDESPAVEANGNIIWFASTRGGGGGGGRDIWVTSLDNGTNLWQPAMAVTEFNTPFDEGPMWRNGLSGRMFLTRGSPVGARLFCDCWRLTSLWIRDCPVRNVMPRRNWLPVFWPRLFWLRRWDWRIGRTVVIEWFDWWLFTTPTPVVTLLSAQAGAPFPSGLPEEGTLALDPSLLVTLGFSFVSPEGQATLPIPIPPNQSLIGLPIAVQGVLYNPTGGSMPTLIWSEPGEAVFAQ